MPDDKVAFLFLVVLFPRVNRLPPRVLNEQRPDALVGRHGNVVDVHVHPREKASTRHVWIDEHVEVASSSVDVLVAGDVVGSLARVSSHVSLIGGVHVDDHADGVRLELDPFVLARVEDEVNERLAVEIVRHPRLNALDDSTLDAQVGASLQVRLTHRIAF